MTAPDLICHVRPCRLQIFSQLHPAFSADTFICTSFSFLRRHTARTLPILNCLPVRFVEEERTNERRGMPAAASALSAGSNADEAANGSDVVPAANNNADGTVAAANSANASQSATQTSGASSSGQIGAQDISKIVLDYLSKRGYSRTEAMLRLEASKQGFSHADAEINSLVDNPKAYGRIYTIIRDYIDSSLDLYKPELHRILYPIFVHSYLDLLQQGDAVYARQFLESHASEHEARNQGDIRSFSSLTLPAHIYENQIAQLYRTQKYRLKLSKISLDLLLHLLHENESNGGKIIIRIINQYLSIETTTATPSRLAADGMVQGEGIQGTATRSTALDATRDREALRLGPMPMDSDMVKDVQGELGQTPQLNQILADATKTVDDSPTRENLPLPSYKGVDVLAEVESIKEISKRLHLGPQVAQPSVCMYTFHNSYDNLISAAFSEDVSMMAAGFSESYVQLWSLKGQQGLKGLDDKERSSRRLISHSGPVYAVDFSPDNRYLLSCSEDRSARLWSLDTYSCLVPYKGHNQSVWDVAFGPFGHYFATASHDTTARLWSCDHIYPLRIFAGHLSDVNSVAFHPNSSYLVTGSSDKTCRLWDVQRGAAVRVFAGHTAPVYCVKIAPDGRHMASASDDSTIIIWDIASGRPLKRLRGHASDSSIYSLAFSRESTLLVSGGSDNTVRVWDVLRQPDPNAVSAHGDEKYDQFNFYQVLTLQP